MAHAFSREDLEKSKKIALVNAKRAKDPKW